MVAAANALAIRLRSSPVAAQRAAARTEPRIFSVTPWPASDETRSTRGASRTRRRQAGSAAISRPLPVTRSLAAPRSGAEAAGGGGGGGRARRGAGRGAAHADEPVGHGVDGAVEVSQRGAPQGEVLHRARDVGDAHDVSLGVLGLDGDERAGEVVAAERPGA